MEINLIIRDLLAKHNFISLPGIGSFTQKYEPAFPSADGKSFIPPKQIISFDTTRDFNDEAIENYLCEISGVSRTEASHLLNVFIERLTNDLNDGKTFVFENVGELFKNKKGRIKFEQASDIEAALSTFGLKGLEAEKVTPLKPNKVKAKGQPTPSENVSRSSSSKVFVGVSIVIVIAALAATFVLAPEFRFWEKSLTNQSISESNADSLKMTEAKKLEGLQANSALTKKDSLSTKVEQNITDQNVKKTALYYEEPKIQDNKTFYLVVGSFGKIENAHKLFEKYKKKGFNPEIIQGSNMFRVSISKTTDKNRALRDFNKFRAENPNESVWLLGI